MKNWKALILVGILAGVSKAGVTPIDAPADGRPLAPSALNCDGTGTLEIDGTTLVVDCDNNVITATNQPGVRAYSTGNQATTTGVTENVFFGAEDWDIGDWHDNATSSDTFTVPTGAGGKYYVQCSIRFATNGTGIRQIQIVKQGSTQQNGVQAIQIAPVGADQTSMSMSGLMDLAATNTVACKVYQNSGSTLNITGYSIEIQKLW